MDTAKPYEIILDLYPLTVQSWIRQRRTHRHSSLFGSPPTEGATNEEEIYAEDSTSQVGQEPDGDETVRYTEFQGETGSRVSHVSSANEIMRDAEETFRRRVILQLLRNMDLYNLSITNISDQGITVEGGFAFLTDAPELRINLDDVSEEEMKNYRDQYPAPFTKSTNNRNPRYVRSSPRGNAYRGITENHGRGNRTSFFNARKNEKKETTPPDNGTGGGNSGPPEEPPDSEPSEPSDQGSDDGNESEPDPTPRNNKERSKTPAAFGQQRYRSEDQNYDTKEVFAYDPTARTEEEILRASFQRYEQMITFYLHGPATNLNNAAQKALLSNIGRPPKYNGKGDYVVFDEWISSVIQWMNVADQCGPQTRWSKSKNAHILTSVDMTRTNTLGTLLEKDALFWFREEVQRIPDGFSANADPMAYRWTFMQVINGLYRRFVHEASIATVADRFYEVQYSNEKGIKGVFSELKRYASCMPSPPDLYTFKRRIFEIIPEAMCEDLTKVHRVTAETSNVNAIMQAALECERGDKAHSYYNIRRRESTLRTARKTNVNVLPYQRRSNSPKRLQIVDRRRYSVKAHNPSKVDEAMRSRLKPKTTSYSNQPQSQKNVVCYGCGKPGHFKGDPECEHSKGKSKIDPSKGQSKPRMFRVAEEVIQDGERLFRLEEVESDSEESNDRSDDEIWARYEQDNNDSIEPATAEEPDPWGGSQYDSDAADEPYSNDSSQAENMAHMRDWDSFTEFWSERLAAMATTESPESDNESNSDADLPSVSKSQEIHTLNINEYLRTMKPTDDGGFKATLEATKTKSKRTGTRPTRTAQENRCLAAFVEIQGVRAFVLFDSGSTADAISPEFAQVSHLKVFQLENPVSLQLGTKGSRSKINYGCISQYRLDGGKDFTVTGKDYFDIANIDRYDAIMGTVFMRKHGIALDFEHDVIRVRGKPIPTLTEGEEVGELARRYAKTVYTKIHFKDGEEVPVKPRPKKYGVANSPVDDSKSKEESH